MNVTYNGVTLKIVQAPQIEERAIYSRDGVDLLYTHVLLSCRSVWAPEATSSGGLNAAESLDALRATLLTQRKQLKLSVPSGGATGEKVILLCPLRDKDGTPYPMDANNGPRPLGVNISNIVGENTAIVDFVIECWVKECEYASPIVSNRWEMADSLDVDGYTTRTITGEVVFRTDYMTKYGKRPDDYRSRFLQPTPYGFQRTTQNIVASSDGASIRYTTVDTEMPMFITNKYRGVTRVEGVYWEGYSQMQFNLGEAAREPVRGAMQGFGIGRAAGGGGGGIIGAILVGGVRGIAAPLTTSTFPILRRGIEVRVAGRKTTKRSELVSVAAACAAGYNLGRAAVGGIKLPEGLLNSLYCTVDITRKEVTLRMEYVAGSAPQNILTRLAGAMPGISRDQLPEKLADVADVTSIADGETTNAPNDSNTRAHWIARAFSPDAKTPCEVQTEAQTRQPNNEEA